MSFRSEILPTTPDGQELTFDFFPDASFVGTVQSIDRQPLLTSWSGPLDLPKSIFVITKTADRYQVTASTTKGSFSMSLTPDELYQVQEVEQPSVIDDGALDPSAAPASP